jgi:hypothetical protein
MILTLQLSNFLICDLFLYSYEIEFIQKLLHEKKKVWCCSLQFDMTTFCQFHSYVDSVYPNELEIKDTTECSTFTYYLDVLLKLDTNCKSMTQLYDKRDDFNFSIVNFPYLCSNIPTSRAYGVYISQLIRYARACSAYDQYLVRGSLLTNKLMSQGYQMSRLQAAFHKFHGRYNDLIYPYNLFLGHMLSDMFYNNI